MELYKVRYYTKEEPKNLVERVRSTALADWRWEERTFQKKNEAIAFYLEHYTELGDSSHPPSIHRATVRWEKML